MYFKVQGGFIYVKSIQLLRKFPLGHTLQATHNGALRGGYGERVL